MGMDVNNSGSITLPDNCRIFYQAVTHGEYHVMNQANQELLQLPGIYCIFNSELNLLYIGCSVNVYTRIQTHKRQLLAGNHICRKMVSDYLLNPDSFKFFSIQYFDDSNGFNSESIKNTLFYAEMQYLKRVPANKLYNTLIPASLSEKMLLSEVPKPTVSFKITEIISRLNMSEDSIRSNGFSNTDVLTLEKTIEFVQKRTVASGRWPEEKAILARKFLSELQALIPEKKEDENLLIQGSAIDYFSQISHEKQSKFEAFFGIIASNFNLESFAAWAMFLIPTIASIRNTVSVSGAFSGDYTTSLLITATVSITGILWIVSRAKISGFDMVGILVFQLFEAFSNMVQVFKNLMGSMAYGLTTVSGKPSDLLDMVATLANKDHRDTAIILALGVALFILAAQIKGLLLIKGLKK